MREYNKVADYELEFTVDGIDFYECKHCNCYITSEDRMIEHLDYMHWWIKDETVIIPP